MTTITVRVDDEMFQQVDAVATLTGETRSEVVRMCLREYLLPTAGDGVLVHSQRLRDALKELETAVEKLGTTPENG